MDDRSLRKVVGRLPLAEAALRVWAWVASKPFLNAVFDRHRGRSYERIVTFPVMVYLIADALLHYRGSGRRSFQTARDEGSLEASITAAFGKLRRLPISLSMGFVSDCTVRLMELFPEALPVVELPGSLVGVEPVILDGKAIKRVAKRLKALQGIAGGILGGRALVALRLRQGVAVAMHAHPDGHVNDVRFVPQLLPRIRAVVPGTRIFLGDRQFCLLAHLGLYLEAGDHFLIRYSRRVTFTRDGGQPVRHGHDQEGRAWEEEWGWLGRAGEPQRRYVRRLTVQRPHAEPVSVVTDLLDGDGYPAADLLVLYGHRWGIERCFQQVTEVFGLQGLIGSSPEATVFQFAFCLVLYNILQVIRAYVAQGSQHRVAEVSTENLFVDVQNQLIAWNEVITPQETIRLIEPLSLEHTCRRLKKLLRNVWTDAWRKAPAQKRRPTQHSGKRCHMSAYRLLQASRGCKSKPAKVSSG
jgi:Transposase DDE domain